MTWLGRVRAYCSHDDPAAETANVVALVVGWNGPFYPLYLIAVAGPHAAAALTMLATPLFLSLPLVSRRSSQAGRFGLVLVGTLNTLWCMKLLGPASGVDLFLLLCVVLAALLFRERERIAMWLAVALPYAAWFVPASVIGAPVMQFGPGGMARLHAVNATSVLMLFVVLVLQLFRAVTKGRFGAGSSAGLVWSLNWLIWRSLLMSLPHLPPG